MPTVTQLGDLTGNYVIDTTRTRIGFVARHTLGSRVRGQFDAFEGDVHLDGDDPSRSNAHLTIRATAIQTRNPKRDDILRAKFLRADDHPVITFASTAARRLDESRFRLTGDLTIAGTTNQVAVDLALTGVTDDPSRGRQVAFKGGAVLNRKHWGVNWNAATSATIGSTVVLELEVVATRMS